jgi:uncharacterized protein (DUF924 family)
MSSARIAPQTILEFWYGLDEKLYFTRDNALDAEMTERFATTLAEARRDLFDHWSLTAHGALALTILLDQFSRNIHRGGPDAFAADEKARAVAAQAIDRGFDTEAPENHRRWFYMPFMHSEDLADQERCVELFTAAELKTNIPYAIEHADIIRRFGRFPHRNAILGRASTRDEIEYLESGGFSA